MSRRIVIASGLIGILAVLFFFTPTGEALSQSITHVSVTNFPRVQHVEGEISINTPVRLATLVSFEEIMVAPVAPTETTQLVEAGVLRTDGFPRVVLSLHGLVKGEVLKTGEVGAILVPDQPSIQAAFDEQGQIYFDMRTTAHGVSSEMPYFASTQTDHTVGFQAYRIYLFNTTDKTITANLFAYLSN